MTKTKAGVALAVALIIGAFVWLDLGQYLSLEYLKSQQAALEAYRAEQPLQLALGYFVLYVLVTGLSLPGAAVMTLAGGAVFGLWWGTVLVSFASTIGATVAFLVARLLLRDWVQRRFGKNLQAVNQGIEKEGAFYLFTLRLVPIFPFFVINLVMGLTPIKTLRFFLVSQLGMLPGTVVYVNAGTQLAQIESLGGILSPELLLSFALLGIFPLVAKKTVEWLRRRQQLPRVPRPKRFDTDMVVIGGGSAGLVSAYIGAAVKAKVTLIEKHKMGGDCLNTGCVPSKTLIRTAKIKRYLERAGEYGLQPVTAEVDFRAAMERVQRVIQRIEPHDSMERYRSLGVDCIAGQARITSPYTVEVNGQTLTTRNIVIATGARPAVPRIAGIEQIDYLTSDTVWHLRERPARLLVMGSGPIGCELAQCFARLGCRVSLVFRGERLLPREDVEVSELIRQRFEQEGIEVLGNCRYERFEQDADGVKRLHVTRNGQSQAIEAEQVLLAIGRQPNTEGLGLATIGVELTERGTVAVNEYLQATYPHIFACGDVAGPYQFTHTAAHQAWYVAVNGLFGRFKRFRVDYSVIPWATFTDPEVARVGLNELEAQEQGVPYEISRYDLDDLDRALAEEEGHGFVKVLTVPGKDKILGVTIVGHHAGDIISEFVMAMKHGLGLNKILGTIHIYPTLSEANKFAAGVWKRAHAPQWALTLLERFHRWQRGDKASQRRPEQIL